VRYSFILTRDADGDEPTTVANGSGSARVIARLMRSAADEIDPSPEDPELQHAKGFGDDILQEFLGNPGKKSQQ
jgi:hypothetical protein